MKEILTREQIWLTMKKEVVSAVNFLADLLRVNNNNPLLNADQLVKFKSHVYESLFNHYAGHWFPHNPNKGSGYRCIRINGKMDPLLERAGNTMGLKKGSLRKWFPSELTMWVDPLEVAYRIGENGSICQLYVCKAPKEKSPTPEKEESKNETPAPLPSTPVRAAPPHHQPPSSPQLTSQQVKQQFSPPSKSPPPPQQSPPKSPVLNFNANQVHQMRQQQLAMILMNNHNNNHSTSNCKDSLRNSNLESVRGIERLFVSS